MYVSVLLTLLGSDGAPEKEWDPEGPRGGDPRDLWEPGTDLGDSQEGERVLWLRRRYGSR